jgi:hypothetical protein
MDIFQTSLESSELVLMSIYIDLVVVDEEEENEE